MTVKGILIVCLFVFVLAGSLQAEVSTEQIRTLYDQANEFFRQANLEKDTDGAGLLYGKAILNFEKIINFGLIENAGLYYNLGNCYFLTGRIGEAILNYRRAEKFDGSDQNIKKNLAFARSKRIDDISVKTEEKILRTLFFWHYDLSIKARFVLGCVFFGVLCLIGTAAVLFGRRTSFAAALIVCGILSVCFIVSVTIQYRAESSMVCGVITAQKVIARQGDSNNYSPSFKEPLHEGTEFYLIEQRPGWLHMKLSDGSDGWISDDAAGLL